MTKQEKINELMRITGKGKMACEISLSLTGGDIDKAIERMKISYPGLEVKK
jgi:translation elongation factor EF-Ts